MFKWNLIITFISLTGFASISLLGLGLMPFSSEQGSLCLATMINNETAPCPQSDPLGYASFHNDAVKKISNLTLVDVVTFINLASFLVLVLFGRMLISGGRELVSQSAFIRPEILAVNHIAPDRLAWLALHEKRDPAPVF